MLTNEMPKVRLETRLCELLKRPLQTSTSVLLHYNVAHEPTCLFAALNSTKEERVSQMARQHFARRCSCKVNFFHIHTVSCPC